MAIVGGTGNLGSALALRLGAPGVKIIIGSRDAEKAKKAVETLKPKLRAGEMVGMTNQEAVKGADFVVIAVPYEGHAQMVQDLKGQLAGKIVIDTVVPLNKVKPFVPAAGSALQEAQQILGDEAPVIGALHNISAVDLGDVEVAARRRFGLRRQRGSQTESDGNHPAHRRERLRRRAGEQCLCD